MVKVEEKLVNKFAVTLTTIDMWNGVRVGKGTQVYVRESLGAGTYQCETDDYGFILNQNEFKYID